MKRIFAKSTVMTALMLSSILVVGENAEAAEVKIDSWIENQGETATDLVDNALKQIPSTNFDKDLLFLHNNGNPIETDIIEGETDFYLEAVSKDIVNGIEVVDYYFKEKSDGPRSLEEVEANVNERNKEILQLDSLTPKVTTFAAVASPVIRNFNWTFNESSHKLTTTAELYRRSSTANIDGVNGSVWDVKSITQYERITGKRYLNNMYTRLAVPYANQTLVDWGPDVSTNDSTVSVSLNGYAAGISYTFNTGTLYNTKDLSSKSSKYGRWQFSKNVLPLYANKLKTVPSIRATNTVGAFSVQLSHSLYFDNTTNNTGVITISTPDR